jgi:hypothetical protein
MFSVTLNQLSDADRKQLPFFCLDCLLIHIKDGFDYRLLTMLEGGEVATSDYIMPSQLFEDRCLISCRRTNVNATAVFAR